MAQLTEMTPSQFRKYAELQIKVEAEAQEMGMEIKKFEATNHGSFVSLSIILGYKDDEVKPLLKFARDHAQLFIGKRGGITYPVWLTKVKMVCRPYQGYSILQAVCDQRKLAYSRYI